MTHAADTQPQGFEAVRFEDVLRELESVVDTLEQGELTLEQSLAHFERGVELTRTCQKALDAAEQKVRILTNESPEPFQNHE